jgi:hypothetical protein
LEENIAAPAHLAYHFGAIHQINSAARGSRARDWALTAPGHHEGLAMAELRGPVQTSER